MAEDLLILKLLKIPVQIIRVIWKSFSILTYLPNYLVFLLLDKILFSQTLQTTLLRYILSWPIRFASLVLIIVSFCGEFYFMYSQLQISHLHWGIQILIILFIFQICLVLMRKGYLAMIQKYNPKKLKSVQQHAIELWKFFVDFLAVVLFVINILLLVNIPGLLSYKYNLHSHYGFIKHSILQIRIALVIIIKFFYIKIYFRIFTWRFNKSKKEVEKEEAEHNVLNLLVLLTVLFWQTNLDLFMLSAFGLYCFYLHPRKKLCWDKNKTQVRKYRIVLWFVWNSIIQLFQLFILVVCLPLKFGQALKTIEKIRKSPGYETHFLKQTFLTLSLAALKIPAILCEIVVALSIYKYLRMRAQLKEAKIPVQFRYQAEIEKIQYPMMRSEFIRKKQKEHSRQYIAFRCFGSLMTEILYFPLIIWNTVSKVHNLGWLSLILDEEYNIRKELVTEYFFKNLVDQLLFIPAFFLTALTFVYDPICVIKNIRETSRKRSALKTKIHEAHKKIFTPLFFKVESSTMIQLSQKHKNKIKQDLFLIQMFILTRLTFFSLMDSPNPKSSVEQFQFLLMLFYIKRAQRSKFYSHYEKILKQDIASGLVNNSHDRLRFWKFAHKSIRHHLFQKILCFFMPKKLSNKVKANVPLTRGLSNISNEYWHQYRTTIALIQALIFFIIELVVMAFSFCILLPLTLWRMPSFVMIIKQQKYQKRSFFPILFTIYRQMGTDIFLFVIRIWAFFVCPISNIIFYKRTLLRYNFCQEEDLKLRLELNLKLFRKTEDAKMKFLIRVAVKKFTQILVFSKFLFVKILWVRKRDMNEELSKAKVRSRDAIKEYVFSWQQIPDVSQLLAKVNSMDTLIGSISCQKFTEIVDTYFQVACEDIPYLFIMIFVFATLPWRFFYIKKSLLLMREDKIHRREFVMLIRKISKDYKCIFLYVILLLSIVKTKRTVQLIIRNIKLNFYVGFLKYSHYQELKIELSEAFQFYKSIAVLLLSMIIMPLRCKIILKAVLGLYKQYQQEQKDKKALEEMHNNTIKQGKKQQILTEVGHQVLLNIFSYLDTKEVARMQRVSRYMYQVVRERDEAWMEQWEYQYSLKYQKSINILNDEGQPNYREMCIRSFQKEKSGDSNTRKQNRLWTLAFQSYFVSCTTVVDLKQECRLHLSPSLYHRLFHCLRYNTNEGYGPEQEWPQPDDNPEYLALMNINRRDVVEHSEFQAILSWLIERPVEQVIYRLSRFYNTDTHRKLKQAIYAITSVLGLILFYVGFIYPIWGWFWQLTPAIGVKILLVYYYGVLGVSLSQRFVIESRRWVTLHPFDLVEDIKTYIEILRIKVRTTAQKIMDFVRDRIIKPYVIRPLRWLKETIARLYRQFVQKVVVPLYISISHKVVALWNLIKSIARFTLESLKLIVKTIYKIISKIYTLGISILIFISSSLSQAYFSTLRGTLKFALKFGMIGELVYTLIILGIMISPSFYCYYYFYTKWFLIFSSLATMVMMVTGYRHLTIIKNEVLARKK